MEEKCGVMSGVFAFLVGDVAVICLLGCCRSNPPCPQSPALIENYGSEWSQGSLKWKNTVASVSLVISSDLTFLFVSALLFHWLCIAISWPWWGPVRQTALDGKRHSKGKNTCGTPKKPPWGHWFLHHWASWVLIEFICINSLTCVCDLVCSKVVLDVSGRVLVVMRAHWWTSLLTVLIWGLHMIILSGYLVTSRLPSSHFPMLFWVLWSFMSTIRDFGEKMIGFLLLTIGACKQLHELSFL